MDFLLAAYSTTAVATDLVPQHTYGLQLRCAAGDAAQLGMGELFESWHNWEQCFPERGFPAIFVDPRLFPRALRGDPGQLGVQLSLPERQTQQRWLRLCHPSLLLWWLLLGEGNPGSPKPIGHLPQQATCVRLVVLRRGPRLDNPAIPRIHAEQGGGPAQRKSLHTPGGESLAQLLESRPEELAALADWQTKGDVGQMAIHYSSAKYAASKWGAASALTDQLSWEAIPQEELDKAKLDA